MLDILDHSVIHRSHTMEYFYFSLFVFSCSILVGAHSHELLSMLKGDLARPGDIKYIVGIYLDDQYACGGGIIDKRFILTAAHCFIMGDDKFINRTVTIKAGVTDLADPRAIVVDVEKIYIHGQFNGTLTYFFDSYFDIAVLKLSQELDLDHDQRLQALMLPRMNDKFVGVYVTMAGFGFTMLDIHIPRDESERITPRHYFNGILNTAQAKVLSNDECYWNHYSYLRKGHLCAKIMKNKTESHYGVCSGDSGSPLVYKSRVIIGLLSISGLACDETVDPGVYTRVSSYLGFIKNAINDKDSNMRSFVRLYP